MKDNIKKFIIKYIEEQYKENLTHHFEYCKFPGEECTCGLIESIDEDLNLFNAGYIDSFSMISLCCSLEKEFKIKISDIDINVDNFKNINKLSTLIEKQIK